MPPRYYDFLQCFGTIAAPLAAAGVEVLNATPDSALDVFPLVPLATALGAAA